MQGLTPERLDSFYADLSGDGLANKSVRNIHVLIHRALTDAARRGRVPRNVADLAEPPRLERKVMAVWTAEQMGSFLAHSRQDRWYPLWRLAMTTGMRRGELLGLKWTALDLDAATLTVEQTRVQATGHGAVTSEPKTRAGRRSVNLDPETVTTLRTHRKAQVAERLAAGPSYDDGGWVFTYETGVPPYPETISGYFLIQSAKAGLPPIRFHDLRHSYATAALRAGVPVKVVSQRLGHGDVAVTLGIYAHVLPGDDSDAASKVASLIDG